MRLRWTRVHLEAIGVDLPEERLSSAAIERRLAPLYRELGLTPGYLEELTGIRERRVWPPEADLAAPAVRAGAQALARAGMPADQLGAVVHVSVCRANLEPAAACEIAHRLGAPADAYVYDLTNACVGNLNGMAEVANAIELGQIEAGLVVACESSRAIVERTIARMLAEPTAERFRLGFATMTGGSGAAAVLLTSADRSRTTHRLIAGATENATEHFRLCRWGAERGLLGETPPIMETDAQALSQHGMQLTVRTWRQLLDEVGWRSEQVDKVICHQIGERPRREGLRAIEVSPEKDFSTYPLLGNTGTAGLLISAAQAEEQGFLEPEDRVGFIGVASGLCSMVLALRW